MADSREQIEEIKALLLSEKDKASAYTKLLNLQEISAISSSSAETLADSSPAIITSLVRDIFENDEEIAAQALKCLGFMIYHPTVVASIGGADANVIIESLVKVIITTKIKSVCNLGTWCISIQQFTTSLLDQHIESLIRAIIHALDNPIGSLSTTFEAMQAVVKLTGSVGEKMRNMSNVWAPPIYRRLVSLDKRDRDVSERCLLKIIPVICPPPVTLSKALAVDMKKKLLSAMKELLDKGLKIQSLQAWGWFIRLLGSYAMKNKHVVNEMLKILEHTFADTDSQVQIASLVTWEGLIDAFIQPRAQASHLNLTLGDEVQALRTSEGHSSTADANRHLKIYKLIMAPLIGIMSSKCDLSVHASCLSTWNYLLHKLDNSVSCQSVIETVWGPIIEVVLRVGPDKKNIWFFNFCLDLLDTLILGRDEGTTGKLDDHETSQLSLKNAVGIRLASGKCPSRHYPINCASWKLCQIDFFIKMISILVIRTPSDSVTPEFGLTNDAALRLFGSLLDAVQRAFRSVSITYDEVMQCLKTIFRFLGQMTSEESNNYCPLACLKFLEIVTDKLEPSILESPLYKVGLDLKCIKNLACEVDIRSAIVPVICFMDTQDRVLPVVYLSTCYFSVVMNSSSEGPKYESLLQQMQGFLMRLLSSYCSEEVLRVFIGLLYKSTMFNCLQTWVVLANCVKDCIGSKILKLETETNFYYHVLRLLSYPFASWSTSVNLELQTVVEAWKPLYVSINEASEADNGPNESFFEDLCAMLNGYMDQVKPAVGTEIELQLNGKNCSVEFVLLCGGVITCIMEQLSLNLSSNGSHNVEGDGRISSIGSRMELAARFMKLLLWANKKRTEPSFLSVTPRFFSELVKLVGCLNQNEHILVLIESTSSSLLLWLSEMHLLDNRTNSQLQMLWTEILKRLSQSRPPLKLDSSSLKLHGTLLEKTLDHLNPAISEPTINFWNSTYGTQIKLEFPQNLLPVLDKLSRNGKINLFSRNHFMGDNTSRYKVTTILKKCSKRVEIVGTSVNGHSSVKRKRSELTEHQKEVRRAQQGRAMDCNGRGPGVRTYTTVDFSLGNEESQESQDIRDSESILEMLRKV